MLELLLQFTKQGKYVYIAIKKCNALKQIQGSEKNKGIGIQCVRISR